MSRSGYSESWDCNSWELIRWRGAVNSAIKGKRGQAFLRELLDALDSMPEKKLIADELVTPTGEVCALGRVAQVRGLDVAGVEPDDSEKVAKAFGISNALACEIAFHNDEYWWGQAADDPEARWRSVRAWVERHIVPAVGTEGEG